MRKEEWNEAVNRIDPRLVEEYVVQKERKCRQALQRQKRSVVLIAAALLLTVTLLLGTVVALTHKEPSSTDHTTDSSDSHSFEPIPSFIDIPITHLQAPSDAPAYYGNEWTADTPSSDYWDYPTYGISVTAHLVEILPDTYTFFDDWEQAPFRLLKMKTITLLSGLEMTDEFYLMIPLDFMTDFSVYHTFLLKDIAQYGYDYSVLYNTAKERAEQLNVALFGCYNFGHNVLFAENFIAFDENGVINRKLWTSTQAWNEEAESCFHQYPSTYTLQEAEEEFNVQSNYKEWMKVYLLENLTGEAADALAYIRNPANGTYVQSYSGLLLYRTGVYMRCTRYIHGFSTNETVWISSEEWQGEQIDQAAFSKARFTEEDLQRLPDLRSAYAAVCDAYEAGQIEPPHIQTIPEDARISEGIFGWYAKTDDGVIGIIRVTWRIAPKGSYWDSEYNYDDMYYIIEYGSDVCKPIERDALMEILGEYGTLNVYTGEYDENGKVFTEVQPQV